MHRSSSASHIPRPSRAKSASRVSGRESASVKKFTARARSSDKLTVSSFQRSTSNLSNFKRSSVATPGVKRPLSTSVTPLNLVTPSSVGSSRKRSPFKSSSSKSDRFLNDKRWVLDQFLKVQVFLQEHPYCKENIPGMLKPPTINTFVYVVDLLIKEIDPKTEITMANYKQAVPTTLKVLRFPGTVSNSFLKTVNTIHNWPQVVNVLSWLVDLIIVIQGAKLPKNPQDVKGKKLEAVGAYLLDRYLQFNTEDGDQMLADEYFAQNFAIKVLHVNPREIPELKKDVDDMQLLRQGQEQQLAEKQQENALLSERIEGQKLEIETFYMDNELRQKEIDDMICQAKSRGARLDQKIKAKNENTAKLKETIKKQPCTSKEFRSLLQEVDEIKQLNNLKRQAIAAKQKIQMGCHAKLQEAKKRAQKLVYSLNTEVMELAVKEPELKVLHFSTNFMSDTFQNDVVTVKSNIKSFEKKYSEEIKIKTIVLSTTNKEIASLEHQKELAQNKIVLLDKHESGLRMQIEQCKETMKKLKLEEAEQLHSFEQKISKLPSLAFDLERTKNRLEELRKMKREKELDFEKLKIESVEFFSKVHKEVRSNLTKMNEIRTRVFNKLNQGLEAVQKEQKEILDDLQKLDSLRDQ